MTNDNPTYPLLPFSQLVYDMTKWAPGIYAIYKLSLRIYGISLTMVRNILEKVLLNHPVFQMRVNRKGMQFAEKNVNPFDGPYHKIILKQEEGYLLMELYMNRLLGDERSLQILIKDIIDTYFGKTIEKDKYWEYVAKIEFNKESVHYKNSKNWLLEEYTSDLPVRPTIDRWCLWTILPARAGVCTIDMSYIHKKIMSLNDEKHLTLDGFMSLCTGLAIAEYCGTDAAALTWAYDGREAPEEQHIFGSLHRDVPFKISRKSKLERGEMASREELIREARNQIRAGIAHSDYPYTLTPPYTKRWNYAVNVLRVYDINEVLKYIPVPFEILSMPSPRFAYAMLDVEILEKTDSLYIRFRYSATHYRESSIRRFADLIRKYAEWLVQ